ncbi:potassium-transporting ATPase subunit C [Streptomyces sp. CT34]|uniref:potassium-transporting ATPase subunit C n=1 Tax=Streptomyces sp. CT34 TaxID=1553907 RepID=UPI0006914DB7|nr:potassium-transporting ATPase subunit C [Streptomyces sp. CT34]
MFGPLARLARHHLAALRMLLLFTALTGVVYPLVVTGIPQTAFPGRANGLLIEEHGRPVASSRIGRNVTPPAARGRRGPAVPDLG